MCEFKSAICVKDESVKHGFRLLFSPWSESHSDLCKIYQLAGTDKRLDMAKVEFSPPSLETAHLLDGYKLKIDEDRTPDWFDAEKQERVRDMLRNYIKSCIISGDVDLLIGGQFIVAPGAKISCAREMLITAICGGAVSEICGGTVGEIWGGTVGAIWGGTVGAIRGGTVSAIWGGTVSAIRGGTVGAIRGGTVSAIWGGTVGAIRGGTVGAIGPGAKIQADNRK
jgi:hypothetical protein